MVGDIVADSRATSPGIRTLSGDEFIRRFLLHVLPKGFHRIRHYGLLASAGCKANIARARELIAAPMPEVEPAAAHNTADLAIRVRVVFILCAPCRTQSPYPLYPLVGAIGTP